MEKPFNKRPNDLTDKIVEQLVRGGGEFRIARGQYSETQGPGGVDIVIVQNDKGRKNVLIPTTDSVPQTEGPEQVVWSRKR
jgi:hypothetical protein